MICEGRQTSCRLHAGLLIALVMGVALAFSTGCVSYHDSYAGMESVEVGRIEVAYAADELSSNGSATRDAEVNGRSLVLSKATLKHVESPSFIEISCYKGASFEEALAYFSDLKVSDGIASFQAEGGSSDEGAGWSTTTSEVQLASVDGHDAFFVDITRVAPGGVKAYARYCCIDVDEDTIGLIMAVLTEDQNANSPNLFERLISTVTVL